MRSRCAVVLVLLTGASLGGSAVAAAATAVDIDLPALFGDHMVLQREMKTPIWGTARPGGHIAVTIAEQRKVAAVADDGSWRIILDPLPAGGPYELVVEGEEVVRFSDVLVGEVWLASGQSNMEMPLAGWGKVLDYQTEIVRANYPEMRLFQVEHAVAMQPADDVRSTGWRRCSPKTVADFSSTAYFFARRVHREVGIPVGVIHSSWGGTVAEAWTSAEALEQMAEFRETVREIRSTTAEDLVAMRRAFAGALSERQRAMSESDQGLDEGTPIWTGLDLDDSTWSDMNLPTKWEDAGYSEMDGVVWFRREVEIPDEWVGRGLTLSLGPIDDDDETFFNGVQIGETNGWDVVRRYPVAGGLVRAGRNVVTVRVRDLLYSGGLWGEATDLRLEGPDGETIPLAGPWRFRIGLDSRELEPLPVSPDEPNRPSVLYNGMIEPLAPYALRGVIWYQGESNSARAYQYRTLFPALIRDWRATWGQGDFPFYFVQLAGFSPGPAEKDRWPELREAQAMALSLPATGMAVAIDIGNARDVHPKNKQEVGNRLARLALHRIYGREVADSGPLFRDMERQGSTIRLTFDHAEGGLEAKGGALAGFTIAGEDRGFSPAEARIERDTVVVWSDEVAEPVAVRYGWADYPDCNLYDAAGLPASPFRSDDWPIGDRIPNSRD